MAKRFTLSDKWEKKKFRKFSPVAKLLFLYILDKCDIAGFWEIDIEQAEFSIGESCNLTTALEEISNTYVRVTDTLLWVKNFLYYQSNWPLRDGIPAHKAIARILCEHKSFIETVLTHMESKTSVRVTLELCNSISHSNSISKGRSKGKGHSKDKEKTMYLDGVLLTLVEYEKLKTDYGEYETKAKIKALNDYIMSTGKKYRSHYHTILTWSRKNDIPKPMTTVEKVKAGIL
ncbi:MAG: hypothetical protein ACUZ9M_00780 [Candidatus Scalindua sp.]